MNISIFVILSVFCIGILALVEYKNPIDKCIDTEKALDIYFYWKEIDRKCHHSYFQRSKYWYCSVRDYPTRKAFQQVVEEIAVVKRSASELELYLEAFGSRFKEIQKAYEQRNYGKVIHLAKKKPIVLANQEISPQDFIFQLDWHYLDYRERKHELERLRDGLLFVYWQTQWFQKAVRDVRNLTSDPHRILAIAPHGSTISLFSVSTIRQAVELLHERLENKPEKMAEISELYGSRRFHEAGQKLHGLGNYLCLSNAIYSANSLQHNNPRCSILEPPQCHCGATPITLMVDCVRCGKPYQEKIVKRAIEEVERRQSE